MLLGTDIQAVLTTLRGARRRRDRAQLLDRARGHARRDPLPRRALARCRCTASPTPACRCRGPTARRSSPRARADRGDARRVRRALRRRRSSAAAAARRPTTSRAIAERVDGRVPERAARARPVAGLLDDDRDRRWSRSRARPWSASGSTRRARARRRSCCSPTTTTASSRSPRTRSNGGAHVLDVCVALTERQDEDEQMAQVVKRVSLTQPAPIQVDSTEPEVIKAALEQIPGRAIVNSINLEAGRDKADAVVPLAQGARRGADRADDRRGRDGEDGRAQGRDRQADHASSPATSTGSTPRR